MAMIYSSALKKGISRYKAGKYFEELPFNIYGCKECQEHISTANIKRAGDRLTQEITVIALPDKHL